MVDEPSTQAPTRPIVDAFACPDLRQSCWDYYEKITSNCLRRLRNMPSTSQATWAEGAEGPEPSTWGHKGEPIDVKRRDIDLPIWDPILVQLASTLGCKLEAPPHHLPWLEGVPTKNCLVAFLGKMMKNNGEWGKPGGGGGGGEGTRGEPRHNRDMGASRGWVTRGARLGDALRTDCLPHCSQLQQTATISLLLKKRAWFPPKRSCSSQQRAPRMAWTCFGRSLQMLVGG